MAAVVPSYSGRDRSTAKSTLARWPPSMSVMLETLPTSTPEARTNWPSRRPLALVKIAEYPVVRSNRIWPNTTMMTAVKNRSTTANAPSLTAVPVIFMG